MVSERGKKQLRGRQNEKVEFKHNDAKHTAGCPPKVETRSSGTGEKTEKGFGSRWSLEPILVSSMMK